MMKLALLLLGLAVAYTNAECQDGYWGDGCNTVCGACADNAFCDKKTGECPGACAKDWESAKDQKQKCDVPLCFGSNTGCSGGSGAKCVAPNYCICGELGAQVVGKQVERDGVKGIDCVNLRMDGIIGSVIAMGVMFVSIGICGGIERMRNKSK